MQVLIVLHGMPPLAGRLTVGSGMRAWCNGEALRARGHEVRYVTRAEDLPEGLASEPPRADEDDGEDTGIGLVGPPRATAAPANTFADPGGPLGSPGNPYSFTHRDELVRTVRQLSPDVILVEQFEEARHLGGLGIPVVLDLFAPRILESQFQGPQADQEVVRTLDALNHGDFYVFSNERQKTFYLSLLAISGVDCTRPPVGVVPISCPPWFPEVRKPQRPVFVCGGVFWPWADLRPGLGVLQDHLERRGRGRVEVFGGPYPIRSESTEYADPRETLPRSRRVRYRGLVPIDQLLTAYSGATAAFDVMARNPEREMNLSFRQIDYLRCGLPIVTGRFQEIARDLEAYGAGWVVDPEDEAGIRAVVDQVLDDPAAVARASAAAQRLARDRFSWEETIDPLDAFCRDPRPREKRPTVLAAMSKVTTDLWAEHAEVPRIREALKEQERVNSKKSEEVADLNRQVWRLIDSVDRMSQSIEEVTRFKSVAIQYLGEQEDRAIRSAEEAALEIERLRLDLQKKGEELRAAQEDIETLKGTEGRVFRDLEWARDAVFARDSQLAELRAERERLLAQWTEARSEARDFSADLVKKTQELAGAEERLELGRGQAEARLAEQEGRFLSRLDAAEARARAVLDELRDRIETAVLERDQERARVSELDGVAATLRLDLQKKSKEIEGLDEKRRIESARHEAALAELHALFGSRLDAAEVEARAVVETLRQQLSAIRAERDGLKVRLEGTERAVQELKGELNRRSAELRVERQERRQEQREHEAVRSRLQADFVQRLEQAEAEARNRIEALADQLGRVQNEREELTRRLQHAEALLPDLRRDLRKKSAEIAGLLKSQERLRRDAAEALVRTEGHFGGLIETAEAHAEAVWAELRARLQAASDEQKSVKDQLQRTEEVVQELKREGMKRHSELRELRLRLAEERRAAQEALRAQERAAALAADEHAEALRAAVEAGRDESSALRAEREDLKARVERLGTQVPALQRDLEKKNAELRSLAEALRAEQSHRDGLVAAAERDFVQRLEAAEEAARAAVAPLVAEKVRLVAERDARAEEVARVKAIAAALRADVDKKTVEVRSLDAAVRAERRERDEKLAEAGRSLLARIEGAEAAARDTMSGLIEERARLAAESEARKAEADRFRGMVQALRGDVEKKTVEIRSLAEALRAEQSHRDGVVAAAERDFVQRLEAAEEAARAAVAPLVAEKVRLIAERDARAEEGARVKAIAAALRADVDKKTVEVRSLDAAVRAERRERDEKLAEAGRSLLARIEGAEAAARDTMSGLIEERARLAAESEARKAEADRFRGMVQALRGDVEKKTAEVRGLDRLLRAERAEREGIAAERERDFVARIEAAEQASKDHLSGLVAEVAHLQAERAAREEEAARLRQSVAVLRADVHKKSAELAGEVARARRLATEYDARLAEVTAVFEARLAATPVRIAVTPEGG